jgi:hypothetical protein
MQRIERMTRTPPPAPSKREIWQRILDRHNSGGYVVPIALRWAREVLGELDEQKQARAERAQVEQELEERGPVRMPGEDDEPLSHGEGVNAP